MHWDVNNEQLHGDFFENRTGDIDVLTKLLQEVNNQDSEAKLFLNDYNILNRGSSARVRGFKNVQYMYSLYILSVRR